MGYYGTFDFEIRIPAQHLKAAEQALCEADFGFGAPHSIPCNCDLADMMSQVVYDAAADYEEAAPLTQLALAGDGREPRGDLVLSGGSHQKWRSTIEEMFDLLAPFITPDSMVEICGEEGERVIYRFEDGVRVEDWATVVYTDELTRYKAAETTLAAILNSDKLSPEALAVIQEIHESHAN